MRTAASTLVCWMALLWIGAVLVEPSEGSGVAPRDTIQVRISEGSVLTTMLPETVGETDVERYRLVEGPPFSGVARRSLVWPASEADPGTYDIVLVPAVESPTDTLVVRVQVETDG